MGKEYAKSLKQSLGPFKDNFGLLEFYSFYTLHSLNVRVCMFAKNMQGLSDVNKNMFIMTS